ncbi:hypothetical protein DOTSEDRAFT_69482 [Dothistroma septosporum NZE10]|uniref:Uncharacterized protein n=1 Tax=Dothistroma septosporum (strain NZE10 / CBS 128990) TaxID=675120 RepID=N1PZ88_DOTSN|nr:hypothetical protein DOTSEDRAFT_69482 [Dothistroma septosporum NZE10]
MDTLKKVIMGDPKAESGQEPVSGSQGQGTADAPYDQGNQEDNADLAGKPAQNTREPRLTRPDKAESGQEPISGSQGKGTASEPFDQGNQQDKAGLAGKAPRHTDSQQQAPSSASPIVESLQSLGITREQSTKPRDADASVETDDSEQIAPLTKKPTIGSSDWFTNANPIARKTSVSGAADEHDVNPKAKVSTESQGTGDVEETEAPGKELPPNELGRDVPPGFSNTIVEPASTPRSGELTPGVPNHVGVDMPPGTAAVMIDKGKGKARAIETDDIHSDASNRSELTREESINTETGYTRRTYSTAGTGASSISSRRQSYIQQSGRIPTAGGVPLGARAAADRQHRIDSFIPENEATGSSSRLGTMEYYGSIEPTAPAQRTPAARQSLDAGATKTTPIHAPATKSGDEEKIARRASKKVKGFRKSITKAFKGREGSQ